MSRYPSHDEKVRHYSAFCTLVDWKSCTKVLGKLVLVYDYIVSVEIINSFPTQVFFVRTYLQAFEETESVTEEEIEKVIIEADR